MSFFIYIKFYLCNVEVKYKYLFYKIKENIVVKQATACIRITHLLQSESDNNFGEADQ